MKDMDINVGSIPDGGMKIVALTRFSVQGHSITGQMIWDFEPPFSKKKFDEEFYPALLKWFGLEDAKDAK